MPLNRKPPKCCQAEKGQGPPSREIDSWPVGRREILRRSAPQNDTWRNWCSRVAVQACVLSGTCPVTNLHAGGTGWAGFSQQPQQQRTNHRAAHPSPHDVGGEVKGQGDAAQPQ